MKLSAIGKEGIKSDSTKYTLVRNELLVEVNKDLIRLDKCKEENIILKKSNDNLNNFYNLHLKRIDQLEEEKKQLNLRVSEKDFLINQSIKENTNLIEQHKNQLKYMNRKSLNNGLKIGGASLVIGIIAGLLIH